MLTYSIIYTPDSTRINSDVNYVCSDNKIHVRFRDFNKPQTISGFEKKLTYLMTYLVNYSYISNLIKVCDEETIINAFSKSKDVLKIYSFIKHDKQIDFKNFRFNANYTRKDETLPFGKIEQSAFPLCYDEFGILKEATLDTFLSKLKVNILDYLFDDSYSIILHEKETKDLNKKFTDKETRKIHNIKNDFADLW